MGSDKVDRDSENWVTDGWGYPPYDLNKNTCFSAGVCLFQLDSDFFGCFGESVSELA